VGKKVKDCKRERERDGKDTMGKWKRGRKGKMGGMRGMIVREESCMRIRGG